MARIAGIATRERPSTAGVAHAAAHPPSPRPPDRTDLFETTRVPAACPATDRADPSGKRRFPHTHAAWQRGARGLEIIGGVMHFSGPEGAATVSAGIADRHNRRVMHTGHRFFLGS